MDKQKDCKDTINCPTCKIQINKEHIGERCPRCNSVLLPKSCADCKKICK